MTARASALLAVVLLAGCGGDSAERSSTSQQPAPTVKRSLAEQGKTLFRNKGCIACHSHADVDSRVTYDYTQPPNLTDYRSDPAFLRRWLRDPPAVKPGTRMPDLDLSEPEIDALIAFLNSA